MPLPTPNLDDRTFQDILDDARRMIPRLCPEWTDHNLSDPGITLLELFAWMTDLLLYRLNRVPDKNYVKFLELIGVRLEPAHAATADLTFRLTAPQQHDLVIPRGTAVGTVATENEESIIFNTDQDLTVRVPQLDHVLAYRRGTLFHDYRPALERPQERGLGIFGDPPEVDDGLYLGFAGDLSAHTLALTFSCPVEGLGINPDDPPLAWETWDGSVGDWVPLQRVKDDTGGFNKDGLVFLDTPYTAAATAVGDDPTEAFWIRCRVRPPTPGQKEYLRSPRVLSVRADGIGGLVPASHSVEIVGEVLGISEGKPGQSFQLQSVPVLPRRGAETAEVEGDAQDGRFEAWEEVPNFGASIESDRHFCLDDATGTVLFGPRIRSPKGVERQYGAVPPAGRKLRFSRYRSGGGVVGNVSAERLTMLKSSNAYIEWVTNYAPAIGGTDGEEIEHAKWRGPALLRSTDRAVTAEDFEALALESTSEVARARCLPVRTADGSARPPGLVRLLLVPGVTVVDQSLLPDHLELPDRVRQVVLEYLDERRLLTCEVRVEAPEYTWVQVTAELLVRPQADRARVARDAEQVLYRYLHPVVGGPEGSGWPFGRPLFVAEIYSQLQRVAGVDTIDQLTLHQVDPRTGDPGPPVGRISIPADGLLCSATHRLTVGASETRWGGRRGRPS